MKMKKYLEKKIQLRYVGLIETIQLLSKYGWMKHKSRI